MDFKQAGLEVIHAAKKEGLDHVDALIERTEELEVQIRDNKVEKVEQSTSLGLGIRILNQGRSGFASTEKLDPQTIQKTLLKARSNSEFQDPTDVFMPDKTSAGLDENQLQLYQEELNQLNVENLSRLGLEAEAAARETDPRLTSIPYLGVSRSQTERVLVSTHGVEHSERSNQVGAYCGTLLEDGDLRKSGFEFWSQRKWDPKAGRKLGVRAVEKAAELLGASSIESKKLPVILDEYCAPRLLGMYFRAFYGEAAQKGSSRLKGKLNETIAVDSLTLLDDPHLPGGGASRIVDDEGVPTEPLKLIDSGRFSQFLYHVEPASKDGVSSTGHAARNYDSGISTTTHNLVVKTGEKNLQDLCSIPEECLLVIQLEGAAGCNPISGDISIGVQGFHYKNGRRVQPVDSITIAGNFFDLLLNIREYGNQYQPNLSSRFIPALLVEGFSISG